MIASFRAKTFGGKRSGNGRERQSRLNRADSLPGRLKGEGVQAQAWGAMTFKRAESTKESAGNTRSNSTSTSPESDPGGSRVFSLFTEEDRRRGGDEEDEDIPRRGRAAGGGGGGLVRALSLRPSERRRRTAAAAAAALRSKDARADFRNPMFHTANADAEKAVASLFDDDSRDAGGEQTRAATINGSNPLFKRSASGSGRPRPRANLSVQSQQRNEEEKEKAKEDQPKKKKKEKSMYEHVGRMNVRPFLDDDQFEDGFGHRGFRVDTFARNEGEDGGTAHFKFVFTLDGVEVPSEGGDAKKLRPVLDAIHERATGNLRIRVNDGRQVQATGSSAVDVAITHIGVVLFNPKTMSKGHHLYTLSLNGRTLFSVLA